MGFAVSVTSPPSAFKSHVACRLFDLGCNLSRMSRPVAVFMSRTEAELAKARLQLEGIPAHILADDAGGWEPQFDLSRGVRLMVADRDHDEAREVLELPEHLPEPDRPSTPESERLYRYAAWAMLVIVAFGIVRSVAELL